MATNTARIAVIGTGWWSTFTHIPALQANPDAQLTALCDRDAERLQAAEREYQVGKTYTDYPLMLDQESLDGVVIATPHATHYAIARDCLERGLHVMLEKPMVLHAAEAEHLVRLAYEHNRELIIGYPFNYTAHAIRVRQVLESGELGAIQYVNCVYTSQIIHFLSGHDGSESGSGGYPVHGPGAVYSKPELSGGGQGHLQITHSAGLMFFTTGLRVRRVHALMNNFGLPLDLADTIAVEFEGGALGAVSGYGNITGTDGGKLELLIYCERGNIEMEMISASVVIRRQSVPNEIIRAADDFYPRAAPIDNLVDVALRRGPNRSPAEIGWRTVELLDAAYRSAHSDGQAVRTADLYSAATTASST